MYSSVKFLSPMVIGGFPLPGWDPEAEPELELEAEDPPDALEDDELELPQAASAAMASKLPTITSTRLIMDLAFPSDVVSRQGPSAGLPKAGTLPEDKGVGSLRSVRPPAPPPRAAGARRRS